MTMFNYSLEDDLRTAKLHIQNLEVSLKERNQLLKKCMETLSFYALECSMIDDSYNLAYDAGFKAKEALQQIKQLGIQ